MTQIEDEQYKHTTQRTKQMSITDFTIKSGGGINPLLKFTFLNNVIIIKTNVLLLQA